MDVVDPTVRSKMMGSIHGRDTQPELRVRRYLHAVGLRFRLQARDLPGRPDIVFPSRRVAVFVHGCFWHRHPGCAYATTPSTRADFWQAKFAANIARDADAVARLKELGWQVMTIWECRSRNELDLDSLAWAVLATAE
ncbi:MAG: DNA mismatch endonuclease Vsr, partial [Verrucomicrobiaceae bacterium]